MMSQILRQTPLQSFFLQASFKMTVIPSPGLVSPSKEVKEWESGEWANVGPKGKQAIASKTAKIDTDFFIFICFFVPTLIAFRKPRPYSFSDFQGITPSSETKLMPHFQLFNSNLE